MAKAGLVEVSQGFPTGAGTEKSPGTHLWFVGGVSLRRPSKLISLGVSASFCSPLATPLSWVGIIKANVIKSVGWKGTSVEQ